MSLSYVVGGSQYHRSPLLLPVMRITQLHEYDCVLMLVHRWNTSTVFMIRQP